MRKIGCCAPVSNPSMGRPRSQRKTMSKPADVEATKTPRPTPAGNGARPQGQQPAGMPQGEGTGEASAGLDFVRRVIEEDNRTGRWAGRVATRFPPEPN